MPRPHNLDTLGGRLAYARAMRGGMTQNDLATASGVGQPQISKLERGDNHATTGIARLAKALRVPPEWLELHQGPEPDWKATSSGREPVTPVTTSLPRAQRVVVSANLQIPEAQLFVQLLVAAKLPGVNVEVIEWTGKPKEALLTAAEELAAAGIQVIRPGQGKASAKRRTKGAAA